MESRVMELPAHPPATAVAQAACDGAARDGAADWPLTIAYTQATSNGAATQPQAIADAQAARDGALSNSTAHSAPGDSSRPSRS